jgi:hypothetical protein
LAVTEGEEPKYTVAAVQNKSTKDHTKLLGEFSVDDVTAKRVK